MRIATALAFGLLLTSALRAQFQSNNECISPTSLEIGVNPSPPFGLSGTTYANSFASDSANFAAFNCAPITNDVFFAFTPTCTGNHRVSLCTPPGFASGNISDSVLEVYPFSACAGGGAPLACNDDACGLLSELTFFGTAGASYLLRVGSYVASAPGTFYVSAVPIDLPNDSCAAAAPLAVGPNAGTTNCASPSAAPSCAAFPAGASDAWHAFTPTQNCAFSVTLTGSGGDCLGVYAGSCGGLSPLLCLAGQPPLQTTSIFGVAGTTYYVRVGETEYNGIGGFGPYGLDVQCFTAAASDECAGAVPVLDGINPGAPYGLPGLAFDNVAATDSAGFASPCGGGGHNDVFFQYTSTVDGLVRVATCAPGGGLFATQPDTVLSVYPATACPNGGVPSLACNDDACSYQSEVVFAATYGETYLIRVASFYPGSTGSFYLSIDASQNETCATAQVVSGEGVVHGTTVGAASDGTGGQCAVGPSVWYAFTVLAKADLQVLSSGPPGMTLSLFEGGNCGALGNHVCSVGGQTIHIGEVPAFRQFRLEVFTPVVPGPFSFQLRLTPPSNDTSQYATQVFEGVNPSAPFGQNGIMYSTEGALTDDPYSSMSCWAYTYNHVWFHYLPTCAGPTTVRTTIPPGFAGDAAFDSVLAVYAGSDTNEIACDNNAGGSLQSELTFNAALGTVYLIRVGNVGSPAPPSVAGATGEGSFYLTIERRHCLSMDAPLGPGSVRIRNVNGPPNAPCLSFFTVFHGSYPNGPFFGIDPTVPEIALQFGVAAPPFFNLLDGDGASTFGPLTGAPSGLTLYGVSIPLNGFLQIGTPSSPASFTIP